MAHSEPLGSAAALANPAPLGLMAFGLTTILLNLSNAGFYPLDLTTVVMGLFYGGSVQLIVGAMEFRKGNTFGMTAFLSYGAFWISFASLVLLPKLEIDLTTSSASMGWFLFVWGVFSLLLFLGTLRINGALMLVFGTLFVLFFLLAASFITANSTLQTIGGYEGIICGASAMYASIAQVLNEIHGTSILPLFPAKH